MSNVSLRAPFCVPGGEPGEKLRGGTKIPGNGMDSYTFPGFFDLALTRAYYRERR